MAQLNAMALRAKIVKWTNALAYFALRQQGRNKKFYDKDTRNKKLKVFSSSDNQVQSKQQKITPSNVQPSKKLRFLWPML